MKETTPGPKPDKVRSYNPDKRPMTPAKLRGKSSLRRNAGRAKTRA